MKISYLWLQKYFDTPLPSVEQLADAITFHAFEIDGVETIGSDQVLDVKVLPDRTHDCLSYRGVAKEVAAILNTPLASDPLTEAPKLAPVSDLIEVTIEQPELCNRYIAGYMRGVKVGPSPEWLVERLASMGQRSINNVVDATNFVMFNMGQPLHAFDAGKLSQKNGKYSLGVRYAENGEKMIALDDKEYTLTETMLVINDNHSNTLVGIAGVKGGTPAAITEATTDIIIESANFNGVSVRRTSNALKLRTDASVRFENVISPELAAYGMQEVCELIQKLAGGDIAGFKDLYPKEEEAHTVWVRAADVNRIFGTTISTPEVEAIIKRLGWNYEIDGESFAIDVPFERLDMRITEDVVADIGRIYGYDKIPSVPPPTSEMTPEINKRFYYIDRIRQWLASQGFSEVYTSVFALKGKRAVLNKVASDTPYLRADIWPGLQEVLEMNYRNRDLLGIPDARLFEIGTVWGEKDEKMMIAIGTLGGKQTPKGSEFLQGLMKEFDMKVPGDIPPTPVVQIDLDSLLAHAPDPLAYQDLPTLGDVKYRSFSRYPFIVRDVALWVPEGTASESVLALITENAGPLAVRISMFDTFSKEERTSYAFRIVFQSEDRTLTDEDATTAMEKVYAALKEKGYEIR